MSDFLNKWIEFSQEKLQLAKAMLQEEGISFNSIPIIPQKQNTNTFQLSYGQQRLWFLNQLMPGNPLYNTSFAVRLKGSLNINILEKSFNEIIRRHHVLRTVFKEVEHDTIQEVISDLKVSIIFDDIRHLEDSEQERVIIEQAQKEAKFPFNLSIGPLIRFKLLQVEAAEYIFLLTMHHIISDGWSTGIFINELAVLYQAFIQDKDSLLPELLIQYSDYSAWQRTWMDDDMLKDQIEYWKKQLSGIPDLIELPTDRTRPANQTAAGATYSFFLSEEVSNQVYQIIRKLDATLFQFLFSVFQVLLYRYSGQKDFTVGTPIANRNRSEIEGLIGFFINSLVLRANFNNNLTFNQFLQQVKSTTLSAYSNQDVPFEKLVEVLQPSRTTGYSPLFQVMFVLHNTPLVNLEFGDISIENLELERGTSKFDLIFNCFEDDKKLKGVFEFNTDIFDKQTIVRMSKHFSILLDDILKNPEKKISGLNLLSENERTRILNEWAGKQTEETTDLLILQLIENQVLKNPEAIALRCLDEQVTYGQLVAFTNRLVNYLQKQGIKKGSAVGLCVERSPKMIIALLSILKGGWIFVPLDPGYPQERIKFIVDDANLSAIITETSISNKLKDFSINLILLDGDFEEIQLESDILTDISVTGKDPAYIIYTSGSTGKPKGVLVSHESITNHCVQTSKIYEVTPKDRYLQFAAINFDASLEQIFTALISGAQLILRENDVWLTSDFHKKIENYHLSIINLPTPYWEQLIEEWHKNPELIPHNQVRLFIAGGDALHTEYVKKWQEFPFEQGARLFNAYGPTETTITAGLFDVPENIDVFGEKNLIPIGKPLSNRKFFILDEFGNIVPQNVPGELCIGGNFLAVGYINRKELTKQQFVENPFGEGRIYKTGDLVRWLEDGNVEFLGRKDNQVKIRGFRIELGEIEAAVRNHPHVNDVVVLAKKNFNNEKMLVGYIRTESGKFVSREDIRSFLSNKLPDYMTPSIVMILEEFPLTASGKIDKKALPAPEQSQRELKSYYIAPRTDVEERIAKIVCDMLSLDKVGVFDNFFELGGHSMQAIRIISFIREEFQVEIELRKMFESPNVAGLSQTIMELQADQIDETELEEMLAELENISDEEARNLLND